MPPYQYGSPMMAQNNYEQSLKNIINQASSQLQQIKNQPVQQMPQQPITQNFQLAPNPTNSELESKYANSIDEVKNTFVVKTGIFATKDFSTIWVKDVTGRIKTFKTEEVIEMDEKDKEIYMLKKQIEDMKGMINNANEPVNTEPNVSTTSKKSTRASASTKSNAK